MTRTPTTTTKAATGEVVAGNVALGRSPARPKTILQSILGHPIQTSSLETCLSARNV